MNRHALKHGTAAALVCALWLMNGCKSIDAPAPTAPVTIIAYGENAVSVWDKIAADTINLPPASVGTPQERQPHYALEMATVHIAIYDAVIAIAGTHKPYAITPAASTAGASMETAAGAAAYGVLKGLFPARTATYQAPYDAFLAAVPDSEAKSRGVALGAEVARAILDMRVSDGRETPQNPYVPGNTPGKFRGINPALKFLVNVKPFTLTHGSQFRAGGPPAIGSIAYTKDFNETKAFGATTSPVRSAAQTEVARFHSEPPNRYWTRNLHPFATSQQNLADNARLMASIWVAHADALIACFESKYHFDFWRPTSAIQLAASQQDPATVADINWQPIVPTPNFPEYPAAHSCGAAATAEAIRSFYRTKHVIFKFDSTVPATVVHRFNTTDELVSEIQAARIHGGMHFRTATVDGATMGEAVAKWVAAHHFQKRN